MVKPIIDISYWQDPALINYDQLAAEVDGVILRAAYGVRADTAFNRHYSEFTKRGIPVGAYHFIVEYKPVSEQVVVFLNAVKGKALKLGYWCDVEYEDGADKLTAKSVIGWMDAVEAKVGACGVYAANWCWRAIMQDEYARYSSRKLWCAAYTSAIIIPPGWDGNWYLWQYTSLGRLPGYNANLDMNRLNPAWNSGGSVAVYPEKLVWPIDKATRISQLFGANPQWYPTSKGHNGVDWAATVGTPVFAMQDGDVIIAEERKEKTGYGRQVRIQHKEGISIYGHFSKLLVAKGERVKAGQQIGLSGGATSDPYSGNSTGPHLHAEYRLTSGAPQVPGGYAYGAIDILPLLVDADYQEGEALYKVRVKITNLLIRTGPGKTYPAVGGYASGVYEIFEEQNGYGRIAASRWISLNPAYVEKVQPTPEDGNEPTDAEKLAILWDWYKGQE